MLIYLSLKRLKQRSVGWGKTLSVTVVGLQKKTVDLQMDNIQGAEEDFRVGRGGGMAKKRVISTGKVIRIKE